MLIGPDSHESFQTRERRAWVVVVSLEVACRSSDIHSSVIWWGQLLLKSGCLVHQSGMCSVLVTKCLTDVRLSQAGEAGGG